MMNAAQASQVSIPPREHAVLAGILVDAVAGSPAEGAGRAALRVAAQHGSELGAAERDRLRPGRLGAERALTFACGMLVEACAATGTDYADLRRAPPGGPGSLCAQP